MEVHMIPTLFGLPEAEKLTELNKGHINRTFLAVCGGESYILQSLNRSVFRAPQAVMDNISRIEAAFAKAHDKTVAVPHFLAAGEKNYAEADGEVWRIYSYITASADTAANAAAAGRAFGTFIRIMDGSELDPVPAIEGFHDFDRYFSILSSKSGTDDHIMRKLEKLRGELSQVFTDSMKKRIIHGDAKADNVIMSEKSVIIDLDTVMYGYAAFDCGDLVRSVCKNGYDPDAVKAVTNGFIQGTGGILTPDEISSLPYGRLWLTAELAMRYLIDSKSETRYFRGKTSEECLARANQLLEQL